MSDLIKALINVKDSFSLLAFLAVVLLFAFRTKKVPELMFSLLGEKLTKERFYRILNRGMLLGLAVFGLLCGVAVFGQFLSYKTSASVMTVSALERELQAVRASDEAKSNVIDLYRQAIKLQNAGKPLEAIERVRESVEATPTLVGTETLARLYASAGDTEKAKQQAQEAVALAKAHGSPIDVVRTERMLASLKANSPGDGRKQLVGPKQDLPPGGKSFETATLISPGVYTSPRELGKDELSYYKLRLRRWQKVTVTFRSANVANAYSGASVYGHDGEMIAEEVNIGTPSAQKTISLQAEQDGEYFFCAGNRYDVNTAGAVYSIEVK